MGYDEKQMISLELKKVFEEKKNDFKLKDFKYDVKRVEKVLCCGGGCVNATAECMVENCEEFAIFDTESEVIAIYEDEYKYPRFEDTGVWLCQKHLIEWNYLEHGRFED